MKKVAIIMGSDSDLPVVQKAADVLSDFGVPYEIHIYSAHRTPVEAREFSTTAKEKGLGVIIAAAGMAAHLAGAMAAGTTLPVIGIPIKSEQLGGLASLLRPFGWAGCPFVHGADALRHPRSHGGHRRGQERRHPGGGNFGA